VRHCGGSIAYQAVFWTIRRYLAIGTALISEVRERHENEDMLQAQPNSRTKQPDKVSS
jgi:hypothetical protein